MPSNYFAKKRMENPNVVHMYNTVSLQFRNFHIFHLFLSITAQSSILIYYLIILLFNISLVIPDFLCNISNLVCRI